MSAIEPYYCLAEWNLLLHQVLWVHPIFNWLWCFIYKSKHVVSMFDVIALYLFYFGLVVTSIPWKVPLWQKSINWLDSLICGLNHIHSMISGQLGGHYMDCYHLLKLSYDSCSLLAISMLKKLIQMICQSSYHQNFFWSN